MKFSYLKVFIVLCLSICNKPVNAEKLTIERIFSAPALNGHSPKSLKISPNGKRVTFLQAKANNVNRYDLWEYNLEGNKSQLLVDSDTLFNGEEQLSDEEKARRERQRTYGSGIIEYLFSPNGQALLFPLNGDVYYYRLKDKTVKRLTKTSAFETDIKFSPKGNFVSFIRQQNIFILDINTTKELQLTKDGGGVIKNGMSEFVAQEEMDRMTGYWWSNDEKNIAFLRVDESDVDTVIRNEIYAERIELIEQRYPAAGSNNVKIKLGYVDIKRQKLNFIPLYQGKNNNGDFYLPRVKWLPNSKTISYQWQSRDQKTLHLNFFNLNAKKGKTVLTETSKNWVNLHKDLHFLNDNNSFIWASERDGYKHLYRFNYQGDIVGQLTKGHWVVDSLESIDEKNNWLYFTGRADTPLERHLYKVPLDTKSPEHVVRVSKRNGFHQISFTKNNQFYLDNFSNIATPSTVSMHLATGEHQAWISENIVDEHHPIAPYFDDLILPEFGSLPSSANEENDSTNLFYKLYKPKNMQPGEKYPVIVNVYGGPHVQRVINKFEGPDMTQYMLQQGYIVFQLDNRGSNNRGTDFESPIYQQLGKIEVDDQITGVKFLHSLSFVDKEHIGIYGHSYGGYMALMSMFKAGEYFKAGVAGAPVTDWQLYDTHYTERYLNHPMVNSEGYRKSSVFPYIKGLTGPLMLYHGMADDNVLFTNTTKLMKALQDEGKLFELMTYPGSKHSMRGKKVKVHLNRTIADFFDRYLKNEITF